MLHCVASFCPVENVFRRRKQFRVADEVRRSNFSRKGRKERKVINW